MPAYDNYCNGRWMDSESGEQFEVRNPANPSDVVGTFPQSTAGDTMRAIEAAVGAQPQWKQTPAPERGSILRRAASLLEDQVDELAKTLSRGRR